MNSKAIDLIREFEGLRLSAYNDGLGVPTIGYGTIRWPDGQRVCIGDTCTQDQADEMMAKYIESHLLPHLRTIPGWEKMTEGQQAALISFGYNLGNFYKADGFDTISRALAGMRWDEVPAALRLYVNPGTPVEAGLRRRREAEIHSWLS